jgi:TolB-like protein
MGDGVLVEFGSAVNAVACAAELQKQFAAANEGLAEDRCIVLRVGINLGDVVVEDGDLYGDGVIIAVRLQAMAEPGGICISGSVHEQVAGKLEAAFDDLGLCEVKNSAKPMHVYRLRSGDAAPARPVLALPDKPSIAVLAFENLSGDPEQEYFADGIVEEIITALSRMNWLLVIARNSSFMYKGKQVDVKQAGRELGVRYILEGSVRKAANKVRITGQLIDASSGAHLWAGRFDGALEDIFDLQDQVTASVVGAISPKLEQAEIDRIKSKPTESLGAYDHYLRGLAGLYRWTESDNSEALSHFYKAIALDPAYAAAYGMAARTYIQRNACGWCESLAQDMAETERLARRAAQLGPNDAVALATAGFALADLCGDPQTGADYLKRALDLNPSIAWIWLFSSWVNAYCGNLETAREHIEHARRLSPQDPQNFSFRMATSYLHFIAGRYDDAYASAESAARDKPQDLLANYIAAASAALAGQKPEAERAMGRALRANPAISRSNIVTYQVFYQPGGTEAWMEGLRIAGLPE